MQKPDKIFIHNPNMLHALASNNVEGTVRECSVANQLSTNHTVEYAKEAGDFRVDGTITFEVGGGKKSFEQIANLPDSYVLADSIEYPIGRKLPIWLMEMIY